MIETPWRIVFWETEEYEGTDIFGATGGVHPQGIYDFKEGCCW